jgi:hypothetical protein
LRPDIDGPSTPEADPPAVPLKEDSVVEIRESPARFIFIDGRPLPRPLDSPATALEGGPPPR